MAGNFTHFHNQRFTSCFLMYLVDYLCHLVLQYEPVIEELRRKHEHIIKDRMLTKLKNDRLEAQVSELQASAAQQASQTSPRRSVRAPGPPLGPSQQPGSKSAALAKSVPNLPALGLSNQEAAKNSVAEALASVMRREGQKGSQRALPVFFTPSDSQMSQSPSQQCRFHTHLLMVW